MDLVIQIPYDFHKSNVNVYAPRKHTHHFDWNTVFFRENVAYQDIDISLIITIPNELEYKNSSKYINAPRKHSHKFDWNISLLENSIRK